MLTGLEIFGRKEPEDSFTPITVEILNVTDVTNIPKAPPPSKKRRPKPPKPKPQIKTIEPEKKPEPKPEPKVEKPVDKPIEKPIEKPTEKPAEEPVDELDDFYKDLESEIEDALEQEQEEISQPDRPYDATQPISISEKDAINGLIVSQIEKCWIIPPGVQGKVGLKVIIDYDITREGYLNIVGFDSAGRYNNDYDYRVLADSARRAILNPNCNPLRKIPPLKHYDHWREFGSTFNSTKDGY